MRGNKLEACRISPDRESELDDIHIPDGLDARTLQKALTQADRDALESRAREIREGLLETVGIESQLAITDGRCAMVLTLPTGTDTQKIAQAINMENVEAWCDAAGRVNIAIAPSFSTKDVDQAVLSAVKVVHVLLGLHATAPAAPKTIKQKIISSFMEIMKLRQDLNGK